MGALESEDGDVRRVAAFALGDLGDSKAVEPLIRLYENKDGLGAYAPARWGAVAALGAIGDKRAVPILITALKDPNGTVRSYAAEGLGKLRDASAVEHLIQAYEEDKEKVSRFIGNKELRDNILTSLGEIGDVKAVDTLVGAATSSFYGNQECAREALGKIGAEATDSLLRILEEKERADRDPAWIESIRETAAWALGNWGTSKAIPALQKAAEDESQKVCSAAEEALKKTKERAT